MRTMVMIFVFLICLGSAGTASAAYEYGIRVCVNGNTVSFPDQRPFMDTKVNRTYVPLRFVSESLGAKVDWDSSSQTATVEKDSKTVSLRIGDRWTNLVLDGNQTKMELDAPAMLMNGRTVVPLRFVSEVLGEKVTWSAELRTVYIGEGGAAEDKDFKGILNGYPIPTQEDISVRENPSKKLEIAYAIRYNNADDYRIQVKQVKASLEFQLSKSTVDKIVAELNKMTSIHARIGPLSLNEGDRRIYVGNGDNIVNIQIWR